MAAGLSRSDHGLSATFLSSLSLSPFPFPYGIRLVFFSRDSVCVAIQQVHTNGFNDKGVYGTKVMISVMDGDGLIHVLCGMVWSWTDGRRSSTVVFFFG